MVDVIEVLNVQMQLCLVRRIEWERGQKMYRSFMETTHDNMFQLSIIMVVADKQHLVQIRCSIGPRIYIYSIGRQTYSRIRERERDSMVRAHMQQVN